MPTCRTLRTSRRGITFLEVVLASALLGIVSMGIFSAMNYVVLQQRRAEQALGAAEVANRVVVMFLDNPDDMPSNGQPIAYGRHLYHWDYAAAPITLYDPQATDDIAPLRLDRLRELTVTVWLHEDTGGARRPGPDAPTITVRRMLDPAPTRNPDTLARAMDAGRVGGIWFGDGGGTRSGGSRGGTADGGGGGGLGGGN
ncbi:MAG: type II secretion system protein [Planctomycetota bacterium]